MGLRDIKIATTTIETPGGSFVVRGLSFADVMVIANQFGPQATLVFQKVSGGGEVKTADVQAVIATLVPQVPELVSALIAMASDDYSPEAMKIAARLGFPHQIEALEAIFHLTFASEAELKKLGESILRMVQGASSTLGQMRLPTSVTGVGESVAKSASS